MMLSFTRNEETAVAILIGHYVASDQRFICSSIIDDIRDWANFAQPHQMVEIFLHLYLHGGTTAIERAVLLGDGQEDDKVFCLRAIGHGIIGVLKGQNDCHEGMVALELIQALVRRLFTEGLDFGNVLAKLPSGTLDEAFRRALDDEEDAVQVKYIARHLFETHGLERHDYLSDSTIKRLFS